MSEGLEDKQPAIVASRGTAGHSLESLGRGSATALVGQLVLVAALFGSRVLLVRSLSAAAFGAFALALAIANLLAFVLSLGLPWGLARQSARAATEGERRVLERASLAITIPLAAAVSALIFLGSPYIARWIGQPQLAGVLPYFALYLLALFFLNLLPAFFQGRENLLPNTLFNAILNPSLGLVFLVAFVSGLDLRAPLIGSLRWTPFAIPGLSGPQSAALAYALGALLSLSALAVYVWRWRAMHGRRQALAGSRGAADKPKQGGRALTVRALVRFSLPLSLVPIAMIVPGALDTVVLGYFRSASVVGMYNAIIPMAKLVFLGSFALAAIMLPVSARLLKHGEVRELRESYATSTKWIAIASLPFFVVFFAFPDQSLAFVYGPSAASAAYAMAPTTLRIMSVGAFAATLLGPAGSVLVGMGRLRLVVANMGASVAVDFFGSVLLVPSLGAEGAAIAFSAALVTPAILAVAETRRLLSIDALRWSLAKPLALVLLIVGGGLGMAAGLLHWTPSGLQLVGLFFSVVALYALGILLTRSVEPVDTHLLGIVEKRLGRPLAPVRRLSRRFLDESQVPPARGTEPDSRFL